LSISIKDVGREAGVSKTTVSAVLNNHSNVKPKTREKVLAVIEKLGYKPNITARELVTNTKLTLGIINLVYDLSNEKNRGYFDSVDESTDYGITSVLLDEVSKTKYGLLLERILVSKNKSMTPSFVKSGRVAGIFLIGTMYSEGLIETLRNYTENLVTIGLKNKITDSVRNDYVQSIYSAVQHLIDRGHRRIAFINGDRLSKASLDKLKGYKMALRDASIPFDKSIATYARQFTGQGGYDAFMEIWEHAAIKPSAVVFSTDTLAVGAARYLYEKKIKIPDDVSLVGFENAAMSEFMTPPLTTINRNKNRMGIEACSLMMSRLQNPTLPARDVIVPFSLLERQSVKNISRIRRPE
jgi:LacI family transcriptional regulator/LacI family purine nucleotide synthesis repressor